MFHILVTLSKKLLESCVCDGVDVDCGRKLGRVQKKTTERRHGSSTRHHLQVVGEVVGVCFAFNAGMSECLRMRVRIKVVDGGGGGGDDEGGVRVSS